MWWTSPSPSPYRDLDRGKKEIRLVTLKPRRGWSVRPECELSTVSIDEKPVYTALSYVWGPRVLRNSILLNGKDFKVTDSLYCALLRLRDKTQPCTLWIDAICINQGDREERASQVRLVREIYSSAASTVVYLGEKGPSTLPMELLKMLPSDGNPYNMRELAYNAELSKHWRDLSLMIKNEYWERCWTVSAPSLDACSS